MKKKEKKKKLTAEQTTAQEFTNVLNIQNNYLYTRDGYVIGYIKILPSQRRIAIPKRKRNVSEAADGRTIS